MMKATHCSIISNDCSFINFDCDSDKLIVIDKNGIILVSHKDKPISTFTPSKCYIICSIKFSYVYDRCGKFGVKKIVTKIQLLK